MKIGIHPFPDIVGLTLSQAKEQVDSDIVLRVAYLDGEPQVLTEDIQTSRLNIEVEKGLITNILAWG